MIIYVDTLIFTNTIIDYFLLLATLIVAKRTYKGMRLVLAAIVGGASSLYMFVETELFVVDLLFKLAVGAIMLLIADRYTGVKSFLLVYIIFLLFSFTLNGIGACLGEWFGKILLSKNLILYINVSPIFIISLSVVFYIVIRLLQRIFDKNSASESCRLVVEVDKYQLHCKGFVDSGNLLTDPFGNSQIFVIDKEKYLCFISQLSRETIDKRLRIIPVTTVNKRGILKGIRCDRAVITTDGVDLVFYNPIVLESTEKIKRGYEAIIPKSSIKSFG